MPCTTGHGAAQGPRAGDGAAAASRWKSSPRFARGAPVARRKCPVPSDLRVRVPFYRQSQRECCGHVRTAWPCLVGGSPCLTICLLSLPAPALPRHSRQLRKVPTRATSPRTAVPSPSFPALHPLVLGPLLARHRRCSPRARNAVRGPRQAAQSGAGTTRPGPSGPLWSPRRIRAVLPVAERLERPPAARSTKTCFSCPPPEAGRSFRGRQGRSAW